MLIVNHELVRAREAQVIREPVMECAGPALTAIQSW
jgi:hypothetical protein